MGFQLEILEGVPARLGPFLPEPAKLTKHSDSALFCLPQQIPFNCSQSAVSQHRSEPAFGQTAGLDSRTPSSARYRNKHLQRFVPLDRPSLLVPSS